MLELCGSSHVSDTSLSPGVAAKFAGTAGKGRAYTSFDGVPSPDAFFARTWNVYRTPFASPVTSWEVFAPPDMFVQLV